MIVGNIKKPILKCDDERIELGAPNLMGSSCTAFPATVTIYSNLTSTIITPAGADYELPSIISAKRSKRARLSRVLHRLHVMAQLHEFHQDFLSQKTLFFYNVRHFLY